MVTPEMCCAQYSMLAAEQRLKVIIIRFFITIFATNLKLKISAKLVLNRKEYQKTLI